MLSNLELRRYLRTVALNLLDHGLTSEEVAEALSVPRQTVAAWRAHRTMGSYGH